MSIIFCMIIGLLFSINPISDNDFFWHTVVGNWISNNHVIPNHELFSWVSNKPWTAHEWLTELIMYKLTPIGCLLAMLIIFIPIYILMFKMLKIKFNKIFDFKMIYFLIMCIFFKVTGPRPYILSLLFMAYMIYVLFNYIDNNKKFEKLIWTLPILQIFWVNFHGGSSSLIYIFLIGTLMCHYFQKILKLKYPRWTTYYLTKTQEKNIIIVLGLVVIASCLNPFGVKMLLYPFQNMTDKSMTNYIIEWHSPSFHDLLGIYIFIIVFIPIFNLILQDKKMKFHEVMFQLLMFYMCLKSQRFIGMYGIYSTWTLGKYFFIDEKISDTISDYLKKYKILICCVFILIIGIVGFRQINKINSIGLIDNHGFYSDEAILKLIDLKPKKIFNDYSQGGYLLYKINEYQALQNVKIFSYGLGDVFSRDLLPESINLSDINDNPKKIIDKYQFDYIITTIHHTLHFYLDENENYENIFSDDMCFIYQRKKI